MLVTIVVLCACMISPAAPGDSTAPPPAPAAPAPDPAARRVKPQPPLDVRLEPLDTLAAGRIARFRVTAVPRVPTEEVLVAVRPGPGVAWISGERLARRPARRGEPSEVTFALRVPSEGRHPLHVQVEVTAADGTVWRRGAGLGLGPNPRAERARVVPDGRGGQALEYEAAPADVARGAGR